MLYLCFLQFSAHKKCPVKHLVYRNWPGHPEILENIPFEKSLENVYGQNEAVEQINQLTMYSCNLEGGCAVFFQFPIPLEKVGFPLERICKNLEPSFIMNRLVHAPEPALGLRGSLGKMVF